MLQDWEFGGREVVVEVGEYAVRTFVFNPMDNAVDIVLQALKDDNCELETAITPPDAPKGTLSYTATHQGAKSVFATASIRLDLFYKDDLFVIETRRIAGSAIEEVN